MGHDALARPIWVCKTGRILFETFHPQAAQAESQAMPTGRFGKMSLEPLGNPLGTPWEPLGIRILVSSPPPFFLSCWSGGRLLDRRGRTCQPAADHPRYLFAEAAAADGNMQVI